MTAVTDGDYRDELGAAHARIEELERRLAEVQLGEGSSEPWLAELEAKRAAVLAKATRGLGDPKRRWRARGIVFAVGLALAAALTLVFGTWVPFFVLGGLTLHPGMTIIWALGRSQKQTTQRALAAIDDTNGDVRRMAAMMRARRVRVGAGRELGGADEAEEVEAALDEHARAERRRRS